jgi:hypothetical protein
MYDLVPTMLQLAGLGDISIGMGKSLLSTGVSIAEWGLQSYIDHNDELQAWAYDPAVRAALWNDNTLVAPAQCEDCGIMTVQSRL